MSHDIPLMPPTAGEVHALWSVLTELAERCTICGGLGNVAHEPGCDMTWQHAPCPQCNLYHRAALMIARLERAWLDAQACPDAAQGRE